MRAFLAACLVMLACGDGKRRPDVPYVVITYEVAPEAREQAIQGIRERLDDRGLERPSVVPDPRSPSRLIVELGGTDVPFDRVIELIGRSAVLGIHRVDEGDLARAIYQSAMDEKPAKIYPLVDHVWSEDPAALQAWLLTRRGAARPPADRRVVLERTEETGTGGRPKWRTYVIETPAIVGGEDVVKASVGNDPSTLRPVVQLELRADARDRFAAATEAAIGGKLAIVLDGRVMSAPVVSGKIPAGRIHVTMGGGDVTQQEREAHDLVAVLRTGSIPPLREVERRYVGPAR